MVTIIPLYIIWTLLIPSYPNPFATICSIKEDGAEDQNLLKKPIKPKSSA